MIFNIAFMNTKPLNKRVPDNYLICLNSGCGRAPECIRHFAAENGGDRAGVLQIVNPALKDCGCPYFKKLLTGMVAYGMSHTFDDVRAKDLPAIRKSLVAHFGNGSYYRRRNGEVGITPAEQEYIAGAMEAKGYTAPPVFDRYSEEILW